MDNKKRQDITKRLEKIAKLHGGSLTPDAVVTDARDVKSPLHDQFEWDDETAAHQHRLDQARGLIRTMRVEVTVTSRDLPTPRYVRDPSVGERQGYVEVSTLRNETDLAREVMRTEMGRVTAAIDRARGIADVLGLGTELDEMLAEAVRIAEHVNKVAG